jgi:molybdate transport system substrate-binding protein
LLLALSSPFARAQLTVAAAADLQQVMPEIAARFEKQTGTQVKLSFGASGNLFAQIQNGAPFDLFFSADSDYPRRLVESGRADANTLTQYAEGTLVVWAANDLNLKPAKGLAALQSASIHKIAIANPAHAPYGLAARQALQHAGLWQELQPKLVIGENISQTAQFVQSGNAEAGFIALSLALSAPMQQKGSYYIVPGKLYSPIRQSCVVISGSPNEETARTFLKFIRSPEVEDLLRRDGLKGANVR